MHFVRSNVVRLILAVVRLRRQRFFDPHTSAANAELHVLLHTVPLWFLAGVVMWGFTLRLVFGKITVGLPGRGKVAFSLDRKVPSGLSCTQRGIPDG